MDHLSRTVMTAAVTIFLLGPLGKAPGQGRGPLSPEVTADRRITFRLQAPNARSVQVQGDFTAKTHDLTRDDKGVWSYTSEPLKPGRAQVNLRNLLRSDTPRAVWPTLAALPS